MSMFGGGSSQPSHTTQTTRVEYSPAEEAARSKIFSTGEGLYNFGAPTAGTYQGPAPVNYSAPSTQAFGSQMGVANQVAGQGVGALDFGLNRAMDVNQNPYLQAAMNAAIRPQVQTFTDQVLPSMRLGAVADGSFNGTRQGVAEGIAARGLQDSIASTTASMANAGYNSGMETSTSLLKSLPLIMSGLFAPSKAMSEVGSALETQAQQEENYAAAQRLQAENGPWQLLQNWSNLVSGMSNPTATATSTADRGSTGIGGSQILGAGLSMLPMIMSMFSDRRLKENIEPVAVLADGLFIYEFNYIGQAERQLGLMADEVMELYPEAVTLAGNGYYIVDYDLATRVARGEG
jgi:hypothetical protein